MSVASEILDWLAVHGRGSQKSISAATGRSVQTVKNALGGLARAGRIEKVDTEARTGAAGTPLTVWALPQPKQSRTALEEVWR